MKRAQACSVKYQTADECPRWATGTQVGCHRGLQVVAVVGAPWKENQRQGVDTHP